jgi:hypothetical protein
MTGAIGLNEQITSNPVKMAENWRVAMCALMNLFLTMHRTFSEPMPFGPTELLIYVTVAVANVQKLTRERAIPPGFAASEILPREWVVPISRHAIATSTGLPRETVRRQICKMLDAGILIEDARGGVTLPIGVIKDRGLEPLLEGILTEFARTAEALLRLGVIDVQERNGFTSAAKAHPL